MADQAPSNEESQARLAAIVDSSEDAIVSKNLDGLITSWNRAAEHMFGWTAAEAVGRDITIIVPPDRLPEEEDVLAHIRRGEAVEHFETLRMTKAGRLIPISVTISPIRDQDGRVIGASKIARDISERQRGDLAQARLAAIIDSSDDVIVSKTLEGIITSWNPAAEKMFSWTQAEAVGRHITLIIPPDRWPEEEEVLARVRRGERVDHFETVRVTRHGDLLNVSITVSPIRDGSGHIVGASKIARDIGERRLLEERRIRLLAREQDARLRAESLNRMKDLLIATVAHELRTPLNSIFGWSRMLQNGQMDDAQRARAISTIVRNASAQARLIEDLLDLSRVIAGRMHLDLQPVNLNAVIDAAVEAVRPSAEAKHLAIVVTPDLSIESVMGAADRLQQIFLNLLTNAVKFTPPNGLVQVTVRRSGSTVDIVVKDTGEGIGADTLPHVFEAFRQEDSTSTRAHGGLGLGLALVRELVDAHRGQVRAESPGKGQGATFTVTLPVSATLEPAALHEAVHTGMGWAGPSLHGVRVLVVDDDIESLDMTGTMLRSAGADVRTAASAFRAYEVVGSWQPDVVLTDLAMPGEDGFMLQRGLRMAFARAGVQVPMIAVTAYGAPEHRERALREGFELYLTKPVDPQELASAIVGVTRR
jgi:PAS domain S-box-containing protein